MSDGHSDYFRAFAQCQFTTLIIWFLNNSILFSMCKWKKKNNIYFFNVGIIYFKLCTHCIHWQNLSILTSYLTLSACLGSHGNQTVFWPRRPLPSWPPLPVRRRDDGTPSGSSGPPPAAGGRWSQPTASGTSRCYRNGPPGAHRALRGHGLSLKIEHFISIDWNVEILIAWSEIQSSWRVEGGELPFSSNLGYVVLHVCRPFDVIPLWHYNTE